MLLRSVPFLAAVVGLTAVAIAPSTLAAVVGAGLVGGALALELGGWGQSARRSPRPLAAATALGMLVAGLGTVAQAL